MAKILNWLKIYPLVVITMAVAILFVINVRMNVFSYNNFDMGKFDLGNMAQMLWNTQRGRFMYLTDYFGTNLPRWSMSHVDPILLLFLPVFALFPHPLTLVFSQIAIVLLAAYLVYGICLLNTKSRFMSLMLALSYLAYPAVGFLTARTGFHGVTAAVPFFLLAVFAYEYMYHKDIIRKKWLVLFWVGNVVAIMGKEQIGLYTFLFGIYILFFRLAPNSGKTLKRHAIALATFSIIWFILAFFVIIPAFASQRVEGYEKFAKSLDIQNKNVRNVALENYFLSRYDAFGDSYSDIIIGILMKPAFAIRLMFGSDKLTNFGMTFGPILYLPFMAPQFSLLAVPDMMMNYLTSASGVGTSEIQNHRISMIIPVLFVSIALALALVQTLFNRFRFKKLSLGYVFACVLSVCLLVANIQSSFAYQNPVFMWLRDSVKKHIPQLVAEAKSDKELAENKDLKLGDVLKVSPLENKDRECAQKLVTQIPDSSSVSGPDYLGAHLGLRETYAIFPALYKEADYVIIDVFSKKIANILDIPTDLINDVVNRVINDPNYALQTSCGNLFVFKKVGPHNKTTLLSLQEYYNYTPKHDFTILNGLTVVDFSLPPELKRGETAIAKVVYLKKEQLSNNFIFMSFVNSKTGVMYQTVNLPSFALLQVQDWQEDYYYSEDLELVMPTFLEEGVYRVFLGMSNNIKTRSIYLGDVIIK